LTGWFALSQCAINQTLATRDKAAQRCSGCRPMNCTRGC
jgi:hypothetical protein